MLSGLYKALMELVIKYMGKGLGWLYETIESNYKLEAERKRAAAIAEENAKRLKETTDEKDRISLGKDILNGIPNRDNRV